MKRAQYVVLVAVALILIAAASAWSDPWADYSNAGTGYPVWVDPSYDSGTGLWTFDVYMDEDYSLIALVVYPQDLTPGVREEHWTGYDYTHPAVWTNANVLNGGWEWNRGAPGPENTTAAFGWTGNGSSNAVPGEGLLEPTFSFQAQDLPDGTYDLFVVHLATSDGSTYWVQAPTTPGPPVVPEPGTLVASLSLLAPGGISLVRWRLRRRRASA